MQETQAGELEISSRLEHADQLQLVTAPEVGKARRGVLHVDALEALSQAALEVLAIVAYERPVSRTDISQIRGTDGAGVIDTRSIASWSPMMSALAAEDDPRS